MTDSISKASPPVLLIGASGWNHETWAGGFYPEELPVEWRFCYYSNRLRSVLVPSSAWTTADPGLAQAWVEDSDAAFRFVLELPPALLQPLAPGPMRAGVDEFRDRIAPLAPQVAGLLVRVPGALPVDLLWLRTLLRSLAPDHTLCVELPDAWRSPESLALLTECRAGLCWHPDDADRPAETGEFLVALLAAGDPRRLRAVLEAIGRWQGGRRTAALFFTESPQAPKLAENARALAELMGL